MKETLLSTLRRELARAGDPERAAGQQAYMKSALPFHGVPVPEVRRLCRRVFADLTFSRRTEWERAVRALWRGAKFREERYAAVVLTGHRAARAFQTLQALPLYEELIVTGAWWDLVDELAAHRLGPILAREGAPMRQAMLAWSRDHDLWKRRSAILCQLHFGDATDFALLEACIAPSLGSREFFLRKAIGWALRQHARTDPRAVERYVRAHRRELSPLSQREALKHLG